MHRNLIKLRSLICKSVYMTFDNKEHTNRFCLINKKRYDEEYNMLCCVVFYCFDERMGSVQSALLVCSSVITLFVFSSPSVRCQMKRFVRIQLRKWIMDRIFRGSD